MKYAVYENYPNNKTMVHKENCHCFIKRKNNEDSNGKWYFNLNSFQEAKKFAEKLKRKNHFLCKKCNPEV